MKRLFPILILVAALLLSGVVVAQAGAGYDLSWSTVDSGGGESSAGSYVLSGTVGQPEATGEMTGGAYGLFGGFWSVTLVAAPSAVPVPSLASWALWLLAVVLMSLALTKARPRHAAAPARIN